jgi:peptide/nickel transport system substrate-binding protein
MKGDGDDEKAANHYNLLRFGADHGGAHAQAQSEVVWARDGDIDSFDPQRATSTLSRMVWYQIYDSLLEFDLNGELVPSLARDWEVSDDGLAVTFHLQEGVKCHDGSDFTASDVKFTADRALDDATIPA